MAKKKVAHGGARKGAGRPTGADGPTVTVVATVPESLVSGLEELAQAEGWTKSKAVTEAIRGLLARKSSPKSQKK